MNKTWIFRHSLHQILDHSQTPKWYTEFGMTMTVKSWRISNVSNDNNLPLP